MQQSAFLCTPQTTNPPSLWCLEDPRTLQLHNLISIGMPATVYFMPSCSTDPEPVANGCWQCQTPCETLPKWKKPHPFRATSWRCKIFSASFHICEPSAMSTVLLTWNYTLLFDSGALKTGFHIFFNFIKHGKLTYNISYITNTEIRCLTVCYTTI